MDGYPIQTNFSAGEISPLIYGRVDITRYQNGARRLRNMLVKPQGPAVRRSGTRFVEEVKNSSKLTILRKFEFSKLQAYIFEFGEGYIRIYKDGGILLDASNNPIEIITPYLESELRDLNFTQSADVLYIVHSNHPQAKVSRLSSTDWFYEVLIFKDGPYLSLDDRGYSMSVQSFTDTCFIRSTQAEFVIGDVGKYVEIVFKNRLVLALITSFLTDTEVMGTIQENTIDYVDLDPKAAVFWEDANGTPASSYNVPNLLAATAIWGTDSEKCFIKIDGVWYKTKSHIKNHKTISGDIFDGMEVEATNPVVLTKAGILTYHDRTILGDVICSHSIFSLKDVGRMLRLNLDSQQVWATITAIVSGSQVTVNWGRKVPFDPKHPDRYISAGLTISWRLGAWYSGNYPSSVTFHEERLTFGGTPLQPQTFWMSSSGDYQNMAPTDVDSKVLDDNAVTFTIASSKVNTIFWMRSASVLLIGTNGGEWQVKANQINQAITPSNISVSSQTEFGSEVAINGERVGVAVIFLQRGGRKVREMMYDYQIDAFQSKDISIVSEHLLRERIKAVEISYQQEPTSIIWMVTQTGDLISATYEKDQEVVAWSAHTLGGSFAGGQAVVESMAIIPSTTGDVIYLVVKRTINGQNKRYIEYIEKEFFPIDRLDKTDMFFVDAGLSYSGSPVSTVSGLDHLEKQVVSVVCDQSYIGDTTVTSGSIVLPNGNTGSNIQVGLSFSSVVETLSIESGSQNGTAQGKTKRIHKLVVRLLSSLGFKYGSNDSELIEYSMRDSEGAMNQSPQLFSGDIEVRPDASYVLDGKVIIVQDQPYPLIVIALMTHLSTNT